MDPFISGDPISYAETMRTFGNKDFRNGNYSLAIKKYDEAMRALLFSHQTRGFSHHQDMAVLMCNRSNAFYNLNKWKEAFYSAQESLSWDPTYVKGYYRAGYSLIKWSQNSDKVSSCDEAAQMFCAGLKVLGMSSDVGQVSDFIVGVFSCVNNEKTISLQFVSICKQLVNDYYSVSVWQQVIEKLAKKGFWQSCLLLSTEKNRLPKKLRVTNLSLKDLFETYVLFGQYEKMERIPKLVEWLISIGADIGSIGAYPLHAVIILCIKAKGSHLFRWLLDHKPELKDLINQQDEAGSTVLHVVASHSNGYSIKNQIEDVVMLLKAGVNPQICDAQSRSAVDILKTHKKFKAADIINKHISQHVPSPEESPGQTENKTPEDAAGLLQNAFEQFSQFCCAENGARSINSLMHKSIKGLLRLLHTVKEIPSEIACDVPPACASSFIKLLLEKKMWHEVLLLLTRTATGEMPPGDRLLPNCDLSDLDIGTVLNHLDRQNEFREQLVKSLIDRGASPEGTGTSPEHPLQKCLKKNDFALACLLLKSGTDPCVLSITDGDTPLHAALCICSDKKDGKGIDILKYLLDLYVSSPSIYPYLHPNHQDKNGNTVMHIIFQKNPTKEIKQALGLLAKFDINFNIRNNAGRDVRHRKKKNEPIVIAWNEALAENKKKYRHDPAGQPPKLPKLITACSKLQPTNSSHDSTAPSSQSSNGDQPIGKSPEVSTDSDKQEDAGDAEEKDSAFRCVDKPSTLQDGLVQGIAQLIQKLVLGDVSPKMNSVTSEATKPLSTVSDSADKENKCQQTCSHEELAYDGKEDSFPDKDDSKKNKAPDEAKGGEEAAAAEDDEPFQEFEVPGQDFDNMTWEIECTSETLKKLGSKNMSRYMKNKVIRIIQQLGNGEWTKGLQKQLKHLKGDIQLYEAKLDKGARMLWELAIDFSPRCSENAEKIIENDQSAHPMEKTGRVYTEIIRIWDIVLDHDKLKRTIDMICTAYNRGLSCILRKKLKGINGGLMSSSLKTQKRIPRIYVEDTKAQTPEDAVLPEYFPPASAVETEYNIMKFHSFSTNMALNIVSDMSSTVEYPFRVGELEYAIIGLNPKPLEPIILIGRSGTGKTTCCLYRLWKNFHSYWEKAELAESPLLVRQVWHRLTFDMQLRNKSIQEEVHEEKQDSYASIDSELDSSLSTDNEHEQEEASQCSSNLGDSEMNLVLDSDEEYTVEESDKLDHLHQIFITKNHVLCQEVQRNFTELSKSSKATSHFKPLEANIYKLQDVKDENFPLFLTSKQLLLLLDASMPEPFFLRNEDGSLKHTIDGWSTAEEMVISNWQEEEEDVDVEADHDEEEKATEGHTRQSDPRVFVTYNVFVNEIWPKMVKGKCPYSPALVWKEIKSFLKGSFEALSSHQGILTEEEYKKLGRKRCPNFKEDRSEIYQLFCHYQRIRSQGNYFDEEDVLHKLSQRLSKLTELPWCIHELYGDEIQDFTQAELVLLMKCINDPNAMFLTGDTAQSIIKGVAFRFSDLRSLFYYASKNSGDNKKQCTVRKPKRIYQLYQNYRSHSGILHLASGVVDLLQHFFPESFDRLPRDSGLFDGPKPTVLDSCSVSDLAILLRGNKRKTQPIEFGAHQVILVANEIAKEKIPEELSLALVLTIYEAKGLEFDDVLLYNFFTDSEAYKEWKIISSFVPPSNLPEENELIIETPFEKDVDPPGKHSAVNLEMYKMLNGELKQLYTAITRARVNLWIFDENWDRRAPAFQYFMNREYVQVVKTDENKDFDDSMFVKTSTPEEWVAQGDYYAKHQCWKVAAKCYQKGGATEKEKLALANDAVLKVKSKKISPKEKQMEYLNLAKTYLECGEPNLALKCLIHAKEYKLCAQLCEKLGKMKDAGLFYKRGQCYIDAARCFEQIQEFDLALRTYCQDEKYEEAAMAVERIKKIQKSQQLSPRLPYTADQFYLKAAAKYLHANKIGEMIEALSHLDTEDQLVFLKTHKHFSEAADLLKRENRDEEAAQLMKQHGFVLEAANLTNQMDFRASCLLAAARLCQAGIYQLKDLTAILEEALELSKQTKQKSVSAEATYLLGVLKKDFHTLEEAFWMFLQVNHNAGAVEAVFMATRCEEKSEAILRLASCGIDVLLKLVKAFRKAGTNAEKEMVKSCFEYFAVVQVDEKFCQVSQKEAGCILNFSTENSSPREKKTSDQFIVSLEEVKTVLTKHLLCRLNAIAHRLTDLSFPNMCIRFIAGLQCENETCEDFHRVLTFHEIKSIFQCKMHLAAINKLLLEGKQMFPKEMLHELNAIDTLLTADKYALCKSLLNAIFPKHFHLRMVSKSPASCKHTLSLHRHDYPISHSCRMVLKEYIESEFKNETAQNRRESTDLWLRAMQIFALTSHYPEMFERFLLREEDEYNRVLKTMEERGRGRSKGIEGRYGMLEPDKYAGNAESSHLCFIRLLQESMDQLYIHRNPEECRWLFYRFMNVLVKKCIDPLIPSIGNTVTLLEFQFILGCAVLMRLCRSMTLCLPKSYIALFHFWDFLFARKERHREIFSIIQDYKPEDTSQAIRKFKVHLKYLADVLCNNENFSVLLDAFDDPDCIVSGEAERTVVLCLVMLVNADQVLHWKYKSILAYHFPILKKSLMKMKMECPSKVPERLLHIVDLMSETSDVKEVVEGLKELLFKRDEEFLADCCWRWDPKAPRSTRHEENKVIRGIYYKVADLDRFAYSGGEVDYFEEPETDLEKDIFVEEREDPLASIASVRQQKQQQKASAKRKLQRLFQFVRCLVRWKRIACTKLESSEMPLGIFKRADIDQTQCDLCGVKFLPNPSNFSSQAEPAEMTTPTETDWEEGEIFATGETFESHVNLDEHKKKSTSYQKYSEFFKNMVEPVIHEGMQVIGRIMQNTHIKGHFATNEQSSVEQSKIQDAIQKISDSVEDIYKRKAWADAEETLSKLAKNLNSNLDNVIKWLEKTESCLQKEEEFDDDKDLDNEVKGEEVTFEELHAKKRLRKKGKRKK